MNKFEVLIDSIGEYKSCELCGYSGDENKCPLCGGQMVGRSIGGKGLIRYSAPNGMSTSISSSMEINMRKIDRLIEKELNEENVVQLKRVEDILKLKEFPYDIEIDGIIFNRGGGSASTMDAYINRERVAYQTYIIGSFDKILNKLAIEKFGDNVFQVIFKAQGLSIVPDKVVWGRV